MSYRLRLLTIGMLAGAVALVAPTQAQTNPCNAAKFTHHSAADVL